MKDILCFALAIVGCSACGRVSPPPQGVYVLESANPLHGTVLAKLATSTNVRAKMVGSRYVVEFTPDRIKAGFQLVYNLGDSGRPFYVPCEAWVEAAPKWTPRGYVLSESSSADATSHVLDPNGDSITLACSTSLAEGETSVVKQEDGTLVLMSPGIALAKVHLVSGRSKPPWRNQLWTEGHFESPSLAQCIARESGAAEVLCERKRLPNGHIASSRDECMTMWADGMPDTVYTTATTVDLEEAKSVIGAEKNGRAVSESRQGFQGYKEKCVTARWPWTAISSRSSRVRTAPLPMERPIPWPFQPVSRWPATSRIQTS